MVTIIIPCYNYARFLPSAIDSALAQETSDLPIEVLVIDDGSTDKTAKVAAGYGERIRYHWQENAGLSAARNTGMKLATHDLVFFLDADDLLLPGAIGLLLATWKSLTPPPAILASKFVAIDGAGAPLPRPDIKPTGSLVQVSQRDLIIRNRFMTTVLADRGILLGLGGFDTALNACEDRDMWIRMAAKFAVMLLDRETTLIRKHGSNMSGASARQTEAIFKVLDKAFNTQTAPLSFADRRRAVSMCHYQSSIMYQESGETGTAFKELIQSILAFPWIHLDSTVAPFSRVKRLLNLTRIKLFGPGERR